MCLIAIAWQAHRHLPLVIVANRDEFYQRETLAMHYWPDQPGLLAGRDLQAGGTWLGVNQRGRFAAITNVRETAPQNTSTSRGNLPGLWLNTHLTSSELLKTLEQSASLYSGYNVLFGDQTQLIWASNRGPKGFEHRHLASGIYGLGNASLNTPWPKLRLAKQRLAKQLQLDQPSLEDFSWVTADTCTQDDLSNFAPTDMEESWLRALSAQWIKTPTYGTRAQTLITMNNQRDLTCHERSIDASGNVSSERAFAFTVPGPPPRPD